jgi:hypothetical protein
VSRDVGTLKVCVVVMWAFHLAGLQQLLQAIGWFLQGSATLPAVSSGTHLSAAPPRSPHTGCLRGMRAHKRIRPGNGSQWGISPSCSQLQPAKIHDICCANTMDDLVRTHRQEQAARGCGVRKPLCANQSSKSRNVLYAWVEGKSSCRNESTDNERRSGVHIHLADKRNDLRF